MSLDRLLSMLLLDKLSKSLIKELLLRLHLKHMELNKLPFVISVEARVSNKQKERRIRTSSYSLDET